MTKLLRTKYIVKKEIKEIAAIKCILDLRIKMYRAMYADHTKCRKYEQAALYLHKCLTNEMVSQLNQQI